jgi:ketosteroid isomerase-like protein
VTPGSDDPRIAKAEEAYASLNAGDVDAALERMDPNVVFDWSRSKSPYRGVYEGRDAVRRLFEELRESFDQMQYVTEDWIPAGERLVRIGGVRGRGRGSGVEVAMVGGQVIEFTDGPASRVTLYQTAEEALEAAGLS